MLVYNADLKSNSRQLRKNQTDCEALLWYRLRRKCLFGIQFYRQRPIGNYIVDFYAPQVKLVVELDGSQHFEESQIAYDTRRDEYLAQQGLTVLRFNNAQMLRETEGVMDTIYRLLADRIGKNPPYPPLLTA